MSSAAPPRSVLVTGAHGMLGFHVRARLHVEDQVQVHCAGRPEFDQLEELTRLVRDADAIVHLAGVNRGTDEEVEAGNLHAADRLIEALEAAGHAPTVLFASSTHRDRETVYGRAKREAGARLSAWAARAEARMVEMVLPHIYGEQGRPHYNSVVHTLCHQLVGGEELTIHDRDGQLELLHAGALAQEILSLLRGAEPDVAQQSVRRSAGTPMTVGELADLLTEQHRQYFVQREIPRVCNELELALFNCLRGVAFPAAYPIPLELCEDSRGSLFEAVRSHRAGQTFFSPTRPGVTRGNHFHFGKVERFLVVGGHAQIRIRRLFDNQVHSFEVCGERPMLIDMPTLHTHDITNVGDRELLTLFWAHEFFDPDRPDTFAEPVLLDAPTTAQR